MRVTNVPINRRLMHMSRDLVAMMTAREDLCTFRFDSGVSDLSRTHQIGRGK
jgi:hypothetical protein